MLSVIHRLLKYSVYIIQSLLVCAMLAPTAHATHQGVNGRLLYTSNQTGNDEIFIANYDGTNSQNLTNNSAADGGAAWSPDGLKIAFYSFRDGNNEIYTMHADGTNVQRITNNSASDILPAWSSDGTKIFFQTGRTGNDEIYQMNTDGTNLVNLTNYVANSDRDPEVGGSGKVVFRKRTGSADIYIMDADGSNAATVSGPLCGLTPGCTSDDEASPTLSPDGTLIAFGGQGHFATFQIYKVAVGSTTFTRLTTSATAVQDQPTFTPDGLFLYYISNADGDNEIYRMDINGGNVTKITNNATNDISPAVEPLTIYPTNSVTSQIDASSGGPVSVDILSRHTDAYTAIDPASIVITSAPTKGTAQVDTVLGKIIYTPPSLSFAPKQNWLGRLLSPKAYAADNTDSLTYTACSSAGSELCTNATLSFILGDGSLASTGMDRNNIQMVATASFILSALALIFRAIRKERFTL